MGNDDKPPTQDTSLVLFFFSILQFSELATHYKFITITIYIIMVLVEISRLYLGYEGNLREKVLTALHSSRNCMKSD